MKTRARALCLCLAAVLLCALPVDALGAVKQKTVTLSTKLIIIDLAQGNTQQLTGTVNPTGASQRMVWHSGKPAVAAISQTGLITARKIGTAVVGARPYTNRNWAKAVVQVVDSLAPTSISLNSGNLSIPVGSTYQLSATAYPDAAIPTVAWASSRKAVASVSSDGLVTAKAVGATLIRAASTRNPAVNKIIKVTVTKLPVPGKITISPADTRIEKGATLQLTASVTPSGADGRITWSSGNPAIARVSDAGLVTAVKVGEVKIKAQSKAKSSVYTVRTLQVVDSNAVTSVEIEAESPVLRVGGKAALTAEVLPSTAPQAVAWSSNNAGVATVSSSGQITAKGVGSATITAKAGEKTDTVRVVVLSAKPVAVEPAQVTSVAGINANLAKIDDILRYAVTELDALSASGVISDSEAYARKVILVNAFKMARFPWLSKKTVSYWSGSDKYKANVVYFGIPYTQIKRTYNVEKLLSDGKFKKEGSNSYYTANIPNDTYPGNDCSSFVSMSQWGTGSSYSYQTSSTMKSSSIYKTVAGPSNQKGYENLRPGDIFARNGHVAMFLYYLDSAKSQIMIIQQGGGNTLNTVSCDIKKLSYYKGNSDYVARRKASFD